MEKAGEQFRLRSIAIYRIGRPRKRKAARAQRRTAFLATAGSSSGSDAMCREGCYRTVNARLTALAQNSRPRQLADMIRDHQRRGQSRRLDAEQVDQPGDAMIARALNHEI